MEIIVVTLASVVGGFFVALSGQKLRLKKRNAMMQSVAEVFGGTVRAGAFAQGNAAVHATIDDVSVDAEMWDGEPGPYVRWTAQFSHAAAPVFEVRAWDAAPLATALGKVLGRDFVIGKHAEFDRRFGVFGAQPSVVRAMWSDAALEVMAQGFPKGHIRCGGRTIVLTVQTNATATTIQAGLRLLAELATADIFGVEPLRRLRGAAEVGASGGLPVVTFAGSLDIVAGPVSLGERVVTRVRAPSSEHSEHDIVHVEDGRVFDLHETRLTPDQRSLAKALGTADIEWRRRDLCVTWRDIESSESRLAAGVELVRSLTAAPAQGVFR